MARTWRKGHFGLSTLDGVNTAFDLLFQSFNDDLTANYSDTNIPSDASFSDVAIPTDASFNDQSQPSDPTYEDIKVNG